MSHPQKSPSFRLSRQGFQQLNNGNNDADMAANNQTDNIPLQTVVSHTPSQNAYRSDSNNEKTGMWHRAGRRKLQKIDSRTGAPMPEKRDNSEEKTALNKMGRFYTKILNFSIVTRYMIYVAPLALILAIPIILAAIHPGTVGGTDSRLFWIWIEIIWLSLWGSKVVAHFLPRIFEFLVGVVSPGIRKYVMLLRALEKSLSVVLWMIVNQVTFEVLIDTTRGWKQVMQRILRAALVASCIILAERVLIQLISISYHRKQFDTKIKDSKRNIYLLGLLYDASRGLFPSYCNEFAEEDYVIQDSLQFNLGSRKQTHKRSGSNTPLRLLQDVGRVGDKVTSIFGTVAQEITGKKILDPNSAHSIVLEALDKHRSSEALAKRIWMSFVVEGKDALYQEDLVEVMNGNREEAEECFAALDRDGNGDISLEEMILTVTDMHDVDQAINALDALLFTIVFIVCVFVFIAFLSPSFTATLATSATALLSLSFVFAATCQEVLGSCIFLFVKHPYDIGDRVDITSEALTVEHISLLYTVFKRVTNGKTLQIPNIVLNNLWVENVTRSKAMREQVSIFCDFGTSFEDINDLKKEMLDFVHDPQNNRDFHPEFEVEVVSIAEMNKLELRCEIRHKSNWSNEALRCARRSKFMCALVVALRKVPINGPGGGDAALGAAGNPSWSVSIPPAEAVAAREKFNNDRDAARLHPTIKPEASDDKGKSTSTDFLNVNVTEASAINNLNQRKPGVDHVRDDTWDARDDVSTIGRPSMDQRPDIDEVRGLLHKVNSSGKRKQSAQPPSEYSQSQQTLPNQAGPMLSPNAYGNQYAQQQRAPGSPSSISTGHIEEFQYQSMVPPPRSTNRSATPTGSNYPPVPTQQSHPPQRSPSGSNNPYRAQSPTDPEERHPYRP
ncbi:hypothetical protein BU24DRAFT_193406 [Aaosphaeria arxii CBS 175.79]|uniref:EF-hand domain-containing protein n=1 Tax=Aaosphaeria arxii CBS 175.79 TaxID=1450172 RepID=A0A6A5XTP9_9PLEO|nr:uncharacterized protein BU24DRAFT_193406 [Aaosphaeria arxii CBS 175.79]KAF2016091.1 hypothetical protein BU24DRAFT_193406 [Aaosphaeria arxii CBS 175.79]